MKTCKDCVYWNKFQENYGHCKAKPPTIVRGKTFLGQYTGTFPLTSGNDWCGNFSIYWREGNCT